jgi:hypothetical protein
MVADTAADEVMVQDLIADPVDRVRSYELLAEEFGLRGAPLRTAADVA